MSQTIPPTQQHQPGGCSWPAAVVVMVLAALIAFLVYFFLKGAASVPGMIGTGLVESAAKLSHLFGTTVKVDNNSVTLESRGIMELATVQHRIVCVTKYTTTWAGSTATVIVKGVYTAKAGFSFEKGASFRLDETGKVIEESIPPAKILSVEGTPEVFYDAQGVLKSLSAKDYEAAFKQNQAQARMEAVQMGMRDEARTRLKERLQDMLPPPAEHAPSAPVATPAKPLP